MVHGKNRIPYWIDRSLTGLAGPDYDATISFGLPFEPEDSQCGEAIQEHYDLSEADMRRFVTGWDSWDGCLGCPFQTTNQSTPPTTGRWLRPRGC